MDGEWRRSVPTASPRSRRERASERVRAGWRSELGPSPGPLVRLTRTALAVCLKGCLGSRVSAFGSLVKLRGCLSPCRWPSLMKHYSPTDYVNWLEEYKVRQKAGLEARKIVASFSKRFFSEHVRICRWSSGLLPPSGACFRVWRLRLIQPFHTPLSAPLTVPHSLRWPQESLCPFPLSSTEEPFVPASFTFLKPEREWGRRGRDGRSTM